MLLEREHKPIYNIYVIEKYSLMIYFHMPYKANPQRLKTLGFSALCGKWVSSMPFFILQKHKRLVGPFYNRGLNFGLLCKSTKVLL